MQAHDGHIFLADLAHDGHMLLAKLAPAFLLGLMSHQGLPGSWRFPSNRIPKIARCPQNHDKRKSQLGTSLVWNVLWTESYVLAPPYLESGPEGRRQAQRVMRGTRPTERGHWGKGLPYSARFAGQGPLPAGFGSPSNYLNEAVPGQQAMGRRTEALLDFILGCTEKSF